MKKLILLIASILLVVTIEAQIKKSYREYYVCELESDRSLSWGNSSWIHTKENGGRDWVIIDGVFVEITSSPSAAVTGEIKMWPTNTVPFGYLLCDGAAVSRTTYSNLFTLLGTTFGSGDGSTTFNLPNYKGRTPVGRDAGQAEFDAMGETGGAKTHALTSAEMPSHTHVQNAHTHTLATGTTATGNFSQVIGTVDTSSGGTGGTPTQAALGTLSGSTTPTDQNTGGDGAHNNLQPYLTINFIIKI